jgi:hypothetical protein
MAKPSDIWNSQKKMRSVSHPGTHHLRVQLNLMLVLMVVVVVMVVLVG